MATFTGLNIDVVSLALFTFGRQFFVKSYPFLVQSLIWQVYLDSLFFFPTFCIYFFLPSQLFYFLQIIWLIQHCETFASGEIEKNWIGYHHDCLSLMSYILLSPIYLIFKFIYLVYILYISLLRYLCQKLVVYTDFILKHLNSLLPNSTSCQGQHRKGLFWRPLNDNSWIRDA